MRTVLTIAQQKAFLSTNYQLECIEHKWSTREYGSSKLLDVHGHVLAKASGCGYDRFGAALGELITKLFQAELLTLAKRCCKGRMNRHGYKTTPKFYGMKYNAKNNKVLLYGDCGEECMKKILNHIGFEINYMKETNSRGDSGSQFYTLTPISKHTRQYL